MFFLKHGQTLNFLEQLLLIHPACLKTQSDARVLKTVFFSTQYFSLTVFPTVLNDVTQNTFVGTFFRLPFLGFLPLGS